MFKKINLLIIIIIFIATIPVFAADTTRVLMKKETYTIDGLPKAGPYSHVVKAGGFLLLSGIIPLNIAKNIDEKKDMAKATEIVLDNMKTALEKVGSSIEKVVKIITSNRITSFN